MPQRQKTVVQIMLFGATMPADLPAIAVSLVVKAETVHVVWICPMLGSCPGVGRGSGKGQVSAPLEAGKNSSHPSGSPPV